MLMCTAKSVTLYPVSLLMLTRKISTSSGCQVQAWQVWSKYRHPPVWGSPPVVKRMHLPPCDSPQSSRWIKIHDSVLVVIKIQFLSESLQNPKAWQTCINQGTRVLHLLCPSNSTTHLVLWVMHLHQKEKEACQTS